VRETFAEIMKDDDQSAGLPLLCVGRLLAMLCCYTSMAQ